MTNRTDRADEGSVDGLIDCGRWTAAQKLVVALAACAFLAEGMAGQSMGLALPGLIRDWGLPRSAFASAVAWGLVGFAVGAFFGGIAGDRIGRRLLLVGALLLLGIATLWCGATHDVSQLLLVRIVQGLGLGGSLPGATAVIAEFTPARRRSLAMAIGIAFLPIGGLIGGEMAAAVLPVSGWRWVFWWSGVVVLTLGCLTLLLPESPRFLAARPGRQDELRRIMLRIGHPIGDLAPSGLRMSPGASPFSAIFQHGCRRDTITLWVAFFFVMLVMYSMFSWLPTMLTGRGVSLADAGRAISALSSGGIFGGLISGVLTQRLGSRWSLTALALGALGSTVALGMIVGSSHVAIGPLAAALAILGGCVSGSQTTLYALGSHVYPPVMRSTGIGVAIAWGRIGAVLSSYSGVLSLDLGGPIAFFALIGLASLLAWAAAVAVSKQLRSTPA